MFYKTYPGMTDKIVVLSTCASAEEAERLARRVIDGRLAACVNVVAPVRSFYRWKGKVEDSAEWLLIIKTTRGRFEALRAELEIRAHLRSARGHCDPHRGRFAELSCLDRAGAAACGNKVTDGRHIRALIFDMDGVIVDSNPWHRIAWQEYNRGLGVEMTEAMQQTNVRETERRTHP